MNLVSLLKKKNKSKFGLMFGPEASGLSNEDLSFSNYILQIPTSPKFKSLNLSHSLTIISYEIFKIFNENLFEKNRSNIKISSKSKINSLIKHSTDFTRRKRFFSSKRKKTVNVAEYK